MVAGKIMRRVCSGEAKREEEGDDDGGGGGGVPVVLSTFSSVFTVSESLRKFLELFFRFHTGRISLSDP